MLGRNTPREPLTGAVHNAPYIPHRIVIYLLATHTRAPHATSHTSSHHCKHHLLPCSHQLGTPNHIQCNLTRSNPMPTHPQHISSRRNDVSMPAHASVTLRRTTPYTSSHTSPRTRTSPRPPPATRTLKPTGNDSCGCEGPCVSLSGLNGDPTRETVTLRRLSETNRTIKTKANAVPATPIHAASKTFSA